MYNRLYLYLTENDLLYQKQFGLQKRTLRLSCYRSTHRSNQGMFNKNFFIDLFLDLYLFIDLLYRYVFIDFFKAYDTADHKILLKKLSHYGIKNKSLDWFICYLSNRKQLIGYNVHNKSTLYLECHRDPFLDLYCSCFI